MEALRTSQKAMGLPPTQHEPFLLVAMPGLFMTLDSMERTLGGLLEHNPHGKLLLVSVPIQKLYKYAHLVSRGRDLARERELSTTVVVKCSFCEVRRSSSSKQQ